MIEADLRFVKELGEEIQLESSQNQRYTSGLAQIIASLVSKVDNTMLVSELQSLQIRKNQPATRAVVETALAKANRKPGSAVNSTSKMARQAYSTPILANRAVDENPRSAMDRLAPFSALGFNATDGPAGFPVAHQSISIERDPYQDKHR